MPLLDLAALYPDAGSLAPTLFTAATRLAEASAHNRPGAATQASSSVASATDPTVLRDLSSLAALPDAAFFGVVGVHKGLPKVLTTVLDDVAGHRSVRLDAKSYEALVTVLVKITTSIRGDAERWPHPEKVASRLAMLLPAPCLPQLALCLQRKNAAISSIAVTSLLIQAPSILNHMKSVGSSWCDSVQALVANCVDDARRGRYQRKAADILSMAERAHRLSKQLWSLLQACPFIADFLCPLPKLIAALRSIVDTAAPMIQYFVMNSDELASRRQPLLRALASVVNAAVDTALYSLLFVSSHSASARIDFRLVTGPIDEKLSDALAKYGPFVVQAVLKAQPSIPKLLHQLAGGSSAQSGSPDALLASALGELDTERTNVPSVHIFAERVLTALAGLGVNIAMEDLGSNVQAAVTARRAEQQQHQGSASDAAALAAPMKGISASQPPPPASTTHDDPASQMVLDVLPHLNPAHVPAALAYYDGSVEALLDAAMSENLPPHLHDALHSTSLTVSPAVPAAPAAPTARDADDDAEPRPVVPPEAATVVERQGSVYGMLTENFGWDAARPDVDASGSFDGAAPSLDHRDTSEFFTLDEGLKATIAAMANDVYDDERDDGDDDMAPGRRGRAASFEFDSGSDDEDLAAPRRRQTLDAVLAQHGQTSAAPSAGHAAGGSRGGRGGYTAKPKTVVRGAPGQAHSNQTTSTGGAAPASGQQQHDAGRGRGGRPDHRRGGNSRGGGGRGRDEGAKHRHRVQGGHEDD